ncbi:hypothetical protein N7520_000471 [Penicillium odoratum]|uniref:uncharacterized protein n=1 Tax=Penicillium odoratum TaxID=1167516 RepID=UPI002546EDC1|nr:uncharacterized protein N7520_000471 [Penicillium odoratum]KAJ5777225.1 hypothetical protein N7520_000471 [Penicillium odoratum]
MSEDVKMLAPNCVNVNVNALVPQLKRKRSNDPATGQPVPTKIRTDSITSMPVASPIAPSTPTPTRSPAQVAGRTDVDRLRETLTAQLSLEVLLKHNELRLIDQEIAKCQISLEQLRRCAEIPYPGSSVAGISADVSLGTGASVLPGNGSVPVSPAPWGVTDGPYSRHYARWLLPDPRFEGEVDSTPVEGRSTRGNPVDFSALAGKTRPSRGSGAPKLQSLPSGYPVVKEKSGPMVMRRKSDGVFVKLTCLDCQRVDFSSTQGFINHCRIAHNRNFASHDAAAMASGEPVELDESGAIIGSRTESTASAATSGYVHPLIRSSNLPTPTKESVTPKKTSEGSYVATPPTTIRRDLNPRPSEPVKANHPSFLASPATPHLSALMKSRGLGLNMDKLVEEVKTPVDLSGLSDDDSDDESAPSSARTPQDSQGTRAARHPMRMPTAQDATDQSGRKALHLPDMTPTRPQSQSHAPYLSDLASLSAAHQMDASRDLDHPAHLSPNAIESNQAPSLVSDDEDDYEAASDSDSPSSSEADDHEEDFRHIEVQDDERTTAPSAPAEPKPGPSLANPMSQTAPPIPKPMKQGRPALSYGDRTRDDQFNHLRDIPNPVNFTRPHAPSEDPSNTPRDGRNPSPPFSR